MTTSIKITALTDIGANLAGTTLVPVVNMSGTPTTQRANVNNIANYVLNKATGANLGPVANVKITGGTSGQVLTTNGSNVLSWTTLFPTANVDLHNGGVQSGQVLQFSNPNLQAIITGPTPAANVSAERLIIQGQRGNGTGEGGDVYIWAGDANTNGGDIKIYAGDADNVTTGSGGYVNIDGGAGFDYGGAIELTGGYSSNGNGGYTLIRGGSGLMQGGNVTIQGGTSANSLAEYGNVLVNAGGSTWTFDNTGNLIIPGNLIALTASPAPILSGFGSVSAEVFTSSVVTYTGLPAATTAGRKAFISDANLVASGNFGAIVSGGGSNTVPVYSDGTNWRVG